MTSDLTPVNPSRAAGNDKLVHAWQPRGPRTDMKLEPPDVTAALQPAQLNLAAAWAL